MESEEPKPRHVATEFLTLARNGEPEWALLAVKAPFAAVSEAYLEFSKLKEREMKVEIRAAGEAGEEVAPMIAVVLVKGSEWTIILRALYYVRLPDLKHVADAAKALSRELDTRAVTYVGTEESTNGRCELFEKGASVEKAGEKKSIALLTREKIALPACYPTRDGKKVWLAVEKGSMAVVERADLIAR